MPALNGKNLIGEQQPIALPAAFFFDLLPVIDDLAELKVTIFAQASLQQKEGDYRFLRFDEFADDEPLMRGLAVIDDSVPTRELLASALEKAVARGSLLMAQVDMRGGTRRYYTCADEAGRALQQRIQGRLWQPTANGEIELLPPRPSIFGLYEDNIGVLTPMIVDSLKDAEATYKRDWIEEAMRLAVEGNKRNWRYIKAILERWQQEGRWGEKTGRRPRRRKLNRSR